MYAYQNKIIVLIEQLYHLLRPTVDIGAHKAAKTTYTVVYMNDIVAYLYLIELAQRQCEFSAPCPVALKIIFMETVEYLMIGEETVLTLVIHKTLVDCTVNCRKFYIISTVFKYGFQAIGLISGVAENENTVTLGYEISETIGYQSEVLMIQCLRSATEIYRHIRLKISRSVTGSKLHGLHLQKTLFEQGIINHFFHRLRIPFIGNERRPGKALLPDCLHS